MGLSDVKLGQSQVYWDILVTLGVGARNTAKYYTIHRAAPCNYLVQDVTNSTETGKSCQTGYKLEHI